MPSHTRVAATRALHELVDRGFIETIRIGGFNCKSGERYRVAADWLLLRSQRPASIKSIHALEGRPDPFHGLTSARTAVLPVVKRRENTYFERRGSTGCIT